MQALPEYDIHIVPVHPVAVKVTLSPTQIAVLEAAIVGLANSETVTLAVFDAILVQVPILQTAV